MSNKFFIGIAAAFVLIFAIGITAVVGITSMNDRVTVSDYPSPRLGSPSVMAPPVAAFAAETAPPQTAAPAAIAARPQSSAPVPTGQAVFDTDLMKLATSVKLGASNTGDVTKDTWAQQIPVAQKLLAGLCDCDQRNWLNHFVQTGQEAVAGSEHYYESVRLLSTLRRGNDDLSAKPK